MIKEYRSKMDDHGTWGGWWFNIIPLAHTENDQIYFKCWNKDESELELNILLDLSEGDWLKKIRKATPDPSNHHRVKVHVKKDFRTGESEICFGRTSDGWYHLTDS